MKMNELVESLADDFMKMAREKGMNLRVAGTPEQEKQRTMDMLAKRRAEQEHRNREAAGQDHANLHQLEAEYEKMKNEYKSLGGSSWQYADREQNLTASERKARSMEDDLNRLHARIVRARKHGEQGMSEVENEGIASAAMAKLPGFLNTIGKDSQSIARVQDQLNQRMMALGKGHPSVPALNDAHNLLSQMYKNPTEEQAKAFYQAVQKANGAGIRETATAGATSAANIGTVVSPHIAIGKKNIGKKSYTGSPGKSGTKAPKLPKIVQPKNKNGTAKNGLDIKGTSLFGGPAVKRG